MRNFILDTGLRQLWSAKSTTTPAFVGCTGPINSTLVKTARVSWELIGVTSAVEVRPAYRMSDDGITTVTPLVGGYSGTTGWSYDDATNPDDIDTDERLFVQFGFLIRNSSDTGQVEMGQGRMRVEIAPTNGQTLVAGPMKVWSKGANNAQLFHPMVGPMPIELVTQVRGSMQIQSNSGDAKIQLAYQVSNDGITWYSGAASAAAGTFTTFGSELAGTDLGYGTTFATFAPVEAKQLVRFGLAVQNGTAGKSECCDGSIRIDVRGS